MTKETLAYENIDREFKELYVSDIKKTVVAFANTEGGILYIGINDAGEVVGLPKRLRTALHRMLCRLSKYAQLPKKVNRLLRLRCKTARADRIIFVKKA